MILWFYNFRVFQASMRLHFCPLFNYMTLELIIEGFTWSRIWWSSECYEWKRNRCSNGRQTDHKLVIQWVNTNKWLMKLIFSKNFFGKNNWIIKTCFQSTNDWINYESYINFKVDYNFSDIRLLWAHCHSTHIIPLRIKIHCPNWFMLIFH